MEKIIRGITRLVLILSVSLILLNNIDIINADSGWDTDYDYSYDYDYDYDNDSDSDYDYDSDDVFSNNGSSEGELTPIGFLFFFSLFSFPVIFVLIAIITSNKRKNKSSGFNSGREARRKAYLFQNCTYNRIDNSVIKNIIPNFNIESFNLNVYKMFCNVQGAWMDFDYDKMKELLTDELYNSYVMQLEALKVKNRKNIMNNFELVNCYIVDFKEDNGIYVAKVYLDVKFYDYIEDIVTKKVLRGEKYRKLNNTYMLTLISSKQNKQKDNYCPNCGAKLEGNITSFCEYCKTKIINKNYDWVISKKEKIKQK